MSATFNCFLVNQNILGIDAADQPTLLGRQHGAVAGEALHAITADSDTHKTYICTLEAWIVHTKLPPNFLWYHYFVHDLEMMQIMSPSEPNTQDGEPGTWD